jgi:hypothetical protein
MTAAFGRWARRGAFAWPAFACSPFAGGACARCVGTLIGAGGVPGGAPGCAFFAARLPARFPFLDPACPFLGAYRGPFFDHGGMLLGACAFGAGERADGSGERERARCEQGEPRYPAA